MKIEIKTIGENFIERQDEMTSLVMSRKKLLQNPKCPIKTYRQRYRNGLLLTGSYSLLVFLIIIIPFFIKNTKLERIDYVVLIMWTLILLLFIIILINNIRYNQMLQRRKQQAKNRKIIVEINNKEIIYDSNSEGKYILKWSAVKYILKDKYEILFLSENENVISIGISVDYEKEVMDAIKKYKKEDLLVDRTK